MRPIGGDLAASNGKDNYDAEAKAVAAQYGFVDGSTNVTVTVSNSAVCPSGGNDCYSVTITNPVPLYLSQFVGYVGDTKLNGANATTLTSTSIAKKRVEPAPVCLLALASSGTEGIRTNGAPRQTWQTATSCRIRHPLVMAIISMRQSAPPMGKIMAAV